MLEEKKKRFAEQSRKRLSTILATKFRTTFIGCLDIFERTFGFLWGHGKHEDDCTPEELELRAVYQDMRTEVLNHGNNQLRAAQTEVDNHTVEWNRYVMKMTVKPMEEKNG